MFAKYRLVALQFVKFATVGGINTVADFVMYIGLTRGFAFWHERLDEANLLAYVFAVFVSLLLNNFWTFKRGTNRFAVHAAKFLTVAAGATTLNSILFWALTRLGVHDIMTKVIATAIIAGWNFLLYKFWAFADRPLPPSMFPPESKK